MNRTKNIIFFILIISLLIIVGIFVFGKKNTSEQTIGGQKDEHGCLVSAGYSWCQVSGKCLRVFEEFCQDQAKDLVEKIKDISGVELLAKGETTFNWIIHDEKMLGDRTVRGVIYQADGVKWADYDKLEKFLNENYEQDSYNLADGVAGGQRGYLLNYAVCALNFRYAKMKINEEGLAEPDGDNIVVKLECGYFNPNEVPQILLEQKIKEILAMKYGKDIFDVSVTTTKLIGSHFSGIVNFGHGGQGESGMILAIKKDGQWEVIYDGNGSIDCQKMRGEYNFPDEILRPNFCD